MDSIAHYDAMTITLASRDILLLPLLLVLIALGGGVGLAAAGQVHSPSTAGTPVLLVWPDNTQVLRGTYTQDGATIRYRLTRSDADSPWLATDPDDRTVQGLVQDVHPGLLSLSDVRNVLAQYEEHGAGQKKQRE